MRAASATCGLSPRDTFRRLGSDPGRGLTQPFAAPRPRLRALVEERVVVAVRRDAAAEEADGGRGGELVPRARRDEDCVARADAAAVAVDLHVALALEHDVDLLRGAVLVPLRALTLPERRFRQALQRRVMELPNRRPVLRRERAQLVARGNVHQPTAARSTSTTRSWSPGSICVKNGSAIVRLAVSSATGHRPSPNPYASRMYGCRWMHGTYSAVATPSARSASITASRSSAASSLTTYTNQERRRSPSSGAGGSTPWTSARSSP